MSHNAPTRLRLSQMTSGPSAPDRTMSHTPTNAQAWHCHFRQAQPRRPLRLLSHSNPPRGPKCNSGAPSYHSSQLHCTHQYIDYCPPWASPCTHPTHARSHHPLTHATSPPSVCATPPEAVVTPHTHPAPSSRRPTSSTLQPKTALASEPGDSCPTTTTPSPTLDPPRITLWSTTYPSHTNYLPPSQETSHIPITLTHRDIPLPTIYQAAPRHALPAHPTIRTTLKFPGIRNLHDEGQPIMYRTMQRYWEREAHLFQGFNADHIADVERHFADAKIRIQFSINPWLQPPDETLSILNYRREIEDICQERYGHTFLGGMGRYLFLRDISVVMVYQYAGVLDNGLSFHQLEYRNPSKITPGDLMCQCLFRLVFPSQRMAETVYAKFRRHVALTNYAHLIIPNSWELRDDHDKPVTGATAPWLEAICGRRNWPSTQACKPDARRTIQSSRLNTGDLCNWDLPALSFYWRAICYTLHANVRKHRIQKTWVAHCRTCPDSLDTQEHRFGLTHPHRPGSGSLTHDLLLATQARHPQSLAP
ncbi:hypothetical protein H257_15465 [Aphanomyces astaci]|uniref:Uncharacterized protein n=1 Tax=Aphanomyces astaci TaxID=112090 RepID=W4FPB5_APHAT|nr:hypothetical protein H257_15465 [Aphanomyces astaci]ETV68659.1 hypothetical protein H257_15465 [Aphanomyces astaci]|eukprot:XP_009841884.1 hypothetical protein H257_15465 [Aphanomyces astaci]